MRSLALEWERGNDERWGGKKEAQKWEEEKYKFEKSLAGSKKQKKKKKKFVWGGGGGCGFVGGGFKIF